MSGSSIPGEEPRNDELKEIKAQFLASLNHEIRTPLTGILGMLDLLLETVLTEEQREYAESSHICAQSLLEVMNATLEFSALAANQVVLEDSEFSLPEMLETMVGEFECKARSKALALITDLDPSLPQVVVGDALRLKQMLSKLVENAVKFTNLGDVEVSAAAMTVLDGEILLKVSVRDTGIGIPAEKLTCIFESFQQLDSGLSRRYSGMGLGLALTQQLAKLMHAEVSVSSTLGKGSTFTVHIPLRVPGDSPAATVHRILLAGAGFPARGQGIERIHGRRVVVESAESIPAALEAARTVHYDLILLDLDCGGPACSEAIEQFRAIPDYGDVPIVAITGTPESYRRLEQPADMLRMVEKHLYGPRLVSRRNTHPIAV